MATTDGTAHTRDGRAARWDDHRQERRERILEAAVTTIDRDGGGVPVATIAAAADVPRSVVYKIFRDRDDLDEQIRRRIAVRMVADLLPYLTLNGSARELASTAAGAYVNWVVDHPHLHRFIGMGSPERPTVGSPAMRDGKAAFARHLRDLIDSRLPLMAAPNVPPQGAAENLTYAIVGLTDRTVNRWVAGGENHSSAEDLIAFLAEAVCALMQVTVRQSGGELDLDQRLTQPAAT